MTRARGAAIGQGFLPSFSRRGVGRSPTGGFDLRRAPPRRFAPPLLREEGKTRTELCGVGGKEGNGREPAGSLLFVAFKFPATETDRRRY